MEDWVNPTNGSPQVFFTNIANTCYNFQPNSQYSGPIGIKGSQLPKTKINVSGFAKGVYKVTCKMEILRARKKSLNNSDLKGKYFVSQMFLG